MLHRGISEWKRCLAPMNANALTYIPGLCDKVMCMRIQLSNIPLAARVFAAVVHFSGR